MAYVQSQKNNQRLVTMGAVAALHAVAGYALISGLAVKFVEQAPDIFQGTNVPSVIVALDPPPPPPPKRQDPATKPNPPVTTMDSLITFNNSDTIRLPDLVDMLPRDRTETAPLDPPKDRFTPVSVKPRSAPGAWATEADYPSRAIREGREGVTTFTLSIDNNGRVARCDIIGSSGHADLDAKTCELVSGRAKFEPARDGNGEKTSGSYTNKIRWQIPD